MCRELQNNSPGEQKRNCFGVDRGFDCKQWSKSSEPPFLTSKFPLSESVVNVIIKKLFMRHSSFPPTHTSKPIACEGSRFRT